MIADYPKNDPIQMQVSGYLQKLAGNKTCFVTSEVDAERIGEIINACGYSATSILGRRITITIEDAE